MANTRFNVGCPSCEAKITIRSESTIGRKIECPKCKFRFVVQAPADEPEESAEGDAPAQGKKKKGKKEKDAAPPKKNNKVMLGAILGVLAVVGLGLGGYVMFGDDGTDTPKPKPIARGNTPAPTPAPTTKATQPEKPDVVPPTPAVERTKVKDPSNLLPGETVSIWQLRMDDLGATPFRDMFFDANMRDLFKRSMAFEVSDLDEILQANVGTEQMPFAVFRSRGNFNANEILGRMKLATPENNTIKGRKFYLVESNPFLAAVGQALSTQALVGLETPKPKGKPAQPKLALHIYDVQTLLVAEQSILERYLSDLKEDGLPPFQTELTAADPAPATPPAEGGAPAPPPAAPAKAFTSNPSYRTVKPELKRAMNALQPEGKKLPPATYAEVVDQRALNSKELRGLAEANAGSYVAWMQQVKLVGLSLETFNRDKAKANAYFEYLSDDDARKSATEHVIPALNFLLPLYNLRMGDTAAVRDYTMGGAPMPMEPMPGTPAPVPAPGGERGNPEPGPGAPGTGMPPTPVPTESHIDVSRVDSAVVVAFELFWKKGNYQSVIVAGLDRTLAQLKGRMALLGGESDWGELARAIPKLSGSPDGFPRGTLPQETRSDRFNLPPPPDHRVSFFAELLPHLGRGNVRAAIQDRKFPWYAPENRLAAESWVPEFLVPYYDSSAWRATSPLADGATFGGTNYVGLAGLGLDAARYNPLDPATSKKLGIFGYDWQSRPADVTDGLSNTIALIQVPPGYQRPWIAGGGATVMGVDDKGPDPQQPFIARSPEGKRGTYILMGDGSVRWLKEGTDPKVFKALVTRAGGETVDDFDKAAPKQAAKKDAPAAP
jgi:hypothetical protein